MLFITCMVPFVFLTACASANRVTAVSTALPLGELAVKSVTHDADKALKVGDKVHIKVEVENFDPQMSAKRGIVEIFARIANQQGEVLLRNDGMLGDTTADDSLFEGEYTVTDKSKRVVDGKIVVNTYREEVFSEKKITIQP